MVRGLEVFRDYFKNHSHQYVLIGGTACDLLMEEAGLEFRATQDLDIVLFIESLDASFGITFWQFIRDGKYKDIYPSINKCSYRFKNPQDNKFPKMLELFSRKPELLTKSYDNHLARIHIEEDISSLSAILLDDSYYFF